MSYSLYGLTHWKTNQDMLWFGIMWGLNVFCTFLGSGMLKIDFVGELNDKMKGFYRSKYTTSSGETRYAAVTQFEVTRHIASVFISFIQALYFFVFYPSIYIQGLFFFLAVRHILLNTLSNRYYRTVLLVMSNYISIEQTGKSSLGLKAMRKER